FPLVGAILAYLVGRKHKALSGWIATTASVLSFVWVLLNVVKLEAGQVLAHNLFTWIAVGDFSIDFMLRLDHLSAVMGLVVTGVGSLIHFYSIGYMAHDESRPRFFAYLNLFMFSMLLLILGGNLPVLFVGWEGVGFCSYVLIGFWFKNINFAAAGRKAFVVNRIGDAGFLIAMFLLYQHCGTLDFIELSSRLGGLDVQLYTLIALLLFVGATGKSAQIPLFVWLPDAMAGPTPVSALIHAATMVTAGIYLLARMHFLFELAPFALFVVSMIAVLTAFVAATIAMTQNDIKKVLAYSTVSQLGFMFMAAGAGAYWVAIFHVVTHSFFKACLFLCAGSVIHGCHDEQDMRKMGGLAKFMPWTFATYTISTIAIAGIFPFAGYQSKHAILAAIEHTQNPFLQSSADLILIFASLTAFITAFYMTRSLAMTFLGKYRGGAKPHESSWMMVTPLVVLAALALCGGYLLNDVFSLQHYLSHVLPASGPHVSESIVAALTHSWIGILGVVIGLLFYTKLATIPGQIYNLLPMCGKLFSAKYYVDELYGLLIIKPLEGLARIMFRVMDQGIIDGSVNGIAALVDVNGEVLRGVQTGQLRHYALFIFLAAVGIIIFFLVL
ncbi:NADH-quinone oxidoreductase subunit L, partial [Oligoflexia bacterium]|nr:NADH-quinone oxidoreductase subunit L [Oligoflexia bacterium]